MAIRGGGRDAVPRMVLPPIPTEPVGKLRSGEMEQFIMKPDSS